ncbi:uncharacterized protein LOC132283449 [Cornus florida]|uniref:uncharacterized protein LOC132283449 n=1 Tax=Cornus florida TaxID=4283 RepID=UPI00289A4156|nr:uncharacterized protein LOC132283449 [Cornus florida]
MEPNVPVVSKRVWNIVRALFFMLRKGISKRKLMVDLNMMMKRGKIAGKAIVHNLMFHHHTGSTSNTRSHERHVSSSDPREYEFSCSNSPALFPFQVSKLKHHILHHSSFFACAHAPQTDDNDATTVNAVIKALEVLNSEAASPALPGFGRTPLVRQLRITDSPYPLRDGDEDSHVDQAAEEFIMKFYNNLRRQNLMGTPMTR